jgi:hypothetical protein
MYEQVRDPTSADDSAPRPRVGTALCSRRCCLHRNDQDRVAKQLTTTHETNEARSKQHKTENKEKTSKLLRRTRPFVSQSF